MKIEIVVYMKNYGEQMKSLVLAHMFLYLFICTHVCLTHLAEITYIVYRSPVQPVCPQPKLKIKSKFRLNVSTLS